MTALAVCAVMSGAAMAAYNVWTGEYTLTRDEMQAAVAQRFPLTLRYAQMLDVRLSRPRLELDAATNRVTTVLDARIVNALLPAQPIDGTLALIGGIRYDGTRRAVVLDNPTVKRVALQGVPAEYGDSLDAVGSMVARQVLSDYPLYTFKPEELRIGSKEVEPGDITVTPEGLTVKVLTR